MRRGIGIGCMALGICCLIAAVGLMVYNSLEEEHAQDSSMHILQAVQKVLPEGAQKENGSSQSPSEKNKSENSEGVPDDLPQQMVTAQVDGYECIGVLSIPVLELELPVLTKWSYAKLKIAPCHYFGSYYETDFVIAAHNYDAHFGRLTELQPKDLILFTDI